MEEAKPTEEPKPAEAGVDLPWAGNLYELVQFTDRGIVTKTLVDTSRVKLILFGMKAGQTISTHSAGAPTTIHIVSGAGTVRIGETEYEGKAGCLYYVPAGLHHSLTSTNDLVFLLDLFR